MIQSGLKFYDSKSKQIHNVRGCCSVGKNIAIHPKTYLLPFVFTKRKTDATVTEFMAVYECNGAELFSITIPSTLIEHKTTTKLDYYIARFADLFDENLPFETDFPCHQCDGKQAEVYFRVDLSDGSTFYSEVFHVQEVGFGKGDNVLYADTFSPIECWEGNWGNSNAGIGYCYQTMNEGAVGVLRQDMKIGLYYIEITGDVYAGIDKYKLNGKPINFPFGTYSTYLLTDKIEITFEGNVNDVACFSSITAKPITSTCYSFLASRNGCDIRGIPFSDYFDLWVLDGELFEPTYTRNDNAVIGIDGKQKTTSTVVTKQWRYTLSNQLYEPMVDELVRAQANSFFYLWDASWKRALCDGEILISPTFLFEDKCDAQVDIDVSEILANDTGCCDAVIFDCKDCAFDIEGLTAEFDGDIVISSPSNCFDNYEVSYALAPNPLPPATTVTVEQMTNGYLIPDPQVPEGETLIIKVVGKRDGCADVEKNIIKDF